MVLTHPLVIVSFDALGAEDVAQHLDMMPNLAQLIQRGAHVKKVEGIYPTLTYPSHTSIMTGVYPAKHGIVNNTKIQPERGDSPDWYWYAKDIQVPTLFDLAHQKGLKTAAFLWPVSAKAPITWNIAEIFPNRIWTNQVLVSFNASTPYFMFDMNRRFGKLRNGIKQPNLDNFITAAAVDTIKNKKPDLLAVHLVDMDAHRHQFGVRSSEAYAALKRLDAHLGELIAATKVAGNFEDTNFVVLGDHFQIDVDHMIHLNQLFAEQGWLAVTEKGLIDGDWRVLAKTTDGSTYVYIKDDSLQGKVRSIVNQVQGVEAIYQPSDLIKWHINPDAAFIVEAQNGYFFTDEVNRSAVVEATNDADLGTSDRYKAVHGFRPDKPDYQTILVLAGPDIEHITIDDARLVDEAPTFARLLDVEFENVLDGIPLEKVIKR